MAPTPFLRHICTPNGALILSTGKACKTRGAQKKRDSPKILHSLHPSDKLGVVLNFVFCIASLKHLVILLLPLSIDGGLWGYARQKPREA